MMMTENKVEATGMDRNVILQQADFVTAILSNLPGVKSVALVIDFDTGNATSPKGYWKRHDGVDATASLASMLVRVNDFNSSMLNLMTHLQEAKSKCVGKEESKPVTEGKPAECPVCQ